jgi:hypothetical protein
MTEEQCKASDKKASVLQRFLDGFHWCRSWLANILAYASLRAYGFEGFTFDDVQRGAYARNPHKNRDLDKAQELDDLVSASKECYENATSRRTAVTDKCKTLLTMSSLLLGLIGILLPKSLAFDATWMRVVCFIAALALLNTVSLLLIFFDVGRETEMSLDQDDVDLDADNYKKSIINMYLRCQVDTDNRTNYLVDLYRSARFFFLLAFSAVVILFSIQFVSSSPKDQTEQIIQRLRSDPQLIDLLRGPKGEKGDEGGQGVQGIPGTAGAKGDPGKDATFDEAKVIDQLLNDPRLKSMVSEAVQSVASPDN